MDKIYVTKPINERVNVLYFKKFLTEIIKLHIE